MQLSDRIGRRLKLQDLHVLMTVVQAGSMGRAAQRLRTSQPNVSRSIADLEQTLGVRLLDRSRHGVEPTAYGRALLDCGTTVFDELRQGVRSIEFLADPTAGEVKIGAPEPIVVGLLPTVLDRLRRDHPRISVHVTTTVAGAQHYRELRDRKIDLFIGRVTSIEEDMQAERLFHEQVFVVAGASSRWATRRKILLSELAAEPWVLPQQETTIGSAIAEAFRICGVEFPPKGVVWGGASLINALLPKGRFVGALPTSLLRLGINLPQLKVLPVSLPVAPWPVGVVTLKNRTLTPVVQCFTDCVRDVAILLAKAPQGRSRA